jgi:hypothetical protein
MPEFSERFAVIGFHGQTSLARATRRLNWLAAQSFTTSFDFSGILRMSQTSELDGSNGDLEAAKNNSGTKLRSLESVYRKNQIDAIMEMGAELSLLHQKYSAAGCRHLWKQEYADLQLQMSRRTAERYRKIYNAFHDWQPLWERFKLGALVTLAEFADRERRTNGEEALPACLEYIKTTAENWDGVLRRSDVELYCQAWNQFADRPQLLKWFTFEALKLLMGVENAGAIHQAEFAAIELEQDAAAGKSGELIGLEQVQAILDNFADAGKLEKGGESSESTNTTVESESRGSDTNSSEHAESEDSDGGFDHSEFDGDAGDDAAGEDDFEGEAAAGDEADETETAQPTAAQATDLGRSLGFSNRKYLKTYKLSKCDIAIAADSGPVSADEIESLLDELRVILQGEFESELAAAQ